MMKNTMVVLYLAVFALSLSALDSQEEKGPAVYPLLGFSLLALDGGTLQTAGGGAAVMSGDMEPASIGERDNLQVVGLYHYHLLGWEPLSGYPDRYHSLDFVLQRNIQRHRFFALLKSYSDLPVAGGTGTAALVGGYGYEVVYSGGHALALGASLAVSDWGIELPNGEPLPVLVLPFIRYEFTSEWLAFAFDFTTSPMCDFIIAPEQRLRAKGSALFTDLGSNDLRDVKFDLSLEYRLFPADHPLGDFAGLSCGLMGEDYEYDLRGSGNQSLKVSWYAVYGGLDISVLKITGGRAFKGQESDEDGRSKALGDGLFLKVQAACRL